MYQAASSPYDHSPCEEYHVRHPSRKYDYAGDRDNLPEHYYVTPRTSMQRGTARQNEIIRPHGVTLPQITVTPSTER